LIAYEKIKNKKLNIKNKYSKMQKDKTPNSKQPHAQFCFEFKILIIGIYFGFEIFSFLGLGFLFLVFYFLFYSSL
jgi:hypothetical protein